MGNLLDDDGVLVERIAKEWTTLLAAVQLEARMFAERQIYGLTMIQRDIERLRVMQSESDDMLALRAGQDALQSLELAVQALIDSERCLPATLLEMQRYIRALRRVAPQVGPEP
jgi:hypothetical protein